MLVSPRPTAILPSAVGAGDFSPVTNPQANRQSFVPRAERNVHISPPRQISVDTTPGAMVTTTTNVSRESPAGRPPTRRSRNPRSSSAELQRAESGTSMASRGSNSSMNRTRSGDSISSMKRSMSKDSTSSRKGTRAFVVKSKASRSHRSSSATSLPRTPSIGKGGHHTSFLSMTTSNPMPETVKSATVTASPSTGSLRRKALSMSTHEVASVPLMRRTISDGNNAHPSRRSSTDRSINRPRRSSQLRRETPPKTMLPPEFSDDEDTDSDTERLEMRIRRDLDVKAPRARRPSNRSPPTPPTLQLRRTSTSTASATATSPKAVSGLSAVAHAPPQFLQLTQPGPAPVAPPYLTNAQAIVTDLPYAPPTVGSSSSARERITQIQHGEIGLDDPPKRTTSTSDTTSPTEDRSSVTESSGWKPVSLENTRYALTYEAQDMIRRLSNGPPGMIQRTSSPSPPSMPSGWPRPGQSTRTMQKQVMLRDLEREAAEQFHPILSPEIVRSATLSPEITRPDSRADSYFNAPLNNESSVSFDDDPFLNTYPRLNSELRRINKELNNVKRFHDPMTDALNRLAQRKGAMGSPVLATANPQRSNVTLLSLSSSWRKRLSPDKSESPPQTTSPRQNSPSSRSSTMPHEEQRRSDYEYIGEESRLREVTKQLWNSWPERPLQQEPEESEQAEEEASTEAETLNASSTSLSPPATRDSQPQSPAERRVFGSGLRTTWGSALALAGIRSS